MRVPFSPLQLTWDITNRCPAKCIHCYNASDTEGGSVEDCPSELVDSILDDVIGTRPLTLGIGGGDPLVYKGLSTVINAIHGKAGPHMPSVTIGTNGFLIEDRRDLLEAIIDIYTKAPFAVLFYISLHGSNAAIHDKVMATAGAFEQAMRAASFLRSHDVPFGMGVTPLTINLEDLDRIVDVAIAAGATCLNISQFVPTGRGNACLDLTPEQYRWLTEWIVRKNAELGRLYVVTHEHYIAAVDPMSWRNRLFIGCTAGIYQLGIRPNGDIVPCPLLPVVVGNVRKGPLEHVWSTSNVLRDLRQRAVAQPCASCLLKLKCGGCRAVAYAYTGDHLGADVLCPYSAMEIRQLVAAHRSRAQPEVAASLDRGYAAGMLLTAPTDARESASGRQNGVDAETLRRFGYRKAPFPYKRAFTEEIVVLNRLTSQLVSISGDTVGIYELLPDAGECYISVEDLGTRFEDKRGRPLPISDLAALVEAGLVERRCAARE